MRETGAARITGMDRRRGLVGGVPSIVGLLILLGAIGCAGGRVANLDAYTEIPMNRVSPYPSPEELRQRGFEVVIVDRLSPGIDEAQLTRARARVRRALEGIAAEAGAAVIDRSLQDIAAIDTEEVLNELEGKSGDSLSGADYALASRFSVHRYTASWKKPFKFVWQDPAEVEGKPGTCLHKAEVDLDVQLIEIGSNDRAKKTYALSHEAETKSKHPDSSCPIAPAALSVLFERVIDEAVGCLALPLGSQLAPRGHLTAHRKAPEAERHIYRISLGSAHGIEQGDRVEIRRELRSTSPTGDEVRSERVIAVAEVTDQVNLQSSWVATDPGQAADVLLDGDVVRPVFSEGLLSSISGPNCKKIVVER